MERLRRAFGTNKKQKNNFQENTTLDKIHED